MEERATNINEVFSQSCKESWNFVNLSVKLQHHAALVAISICTPVL